MKIVTGYKGIPHISSNDMQALNQGVFGRENYVLDVGNRLSAELSDVNTVTVSDGDGVIQGVHFRIEPGESENVNIANGTVGMNRIDLICARYTKNSSTGVESVELVAIQGEETDSYPTVPTYNEGDILSGASPVDFPLWKVNLNGLSPTLTQYHKVVEPLVSMQNPTKYCDLTGTYISFGTIFYTVYKGFLIFTAAIIPSQNITTSIGTITINDNIGSFDGNAPYFVSAGGANSNDLAVKLAWCQSGTKSFRVVGAFTQGTTYYFSGIAKLV